jgi:hypothetical protein
MLKADSSKQRIRTLYNFVVVSLFVIHSVVRMRVEVRPSATAVILFRPYDLSSQQQTNVTLNSYWRVRMESECAIAKTPSNDFRA